MPIHTNRSRTEYEKRMHRVLAYIDQHLDQSIDLIGLAEVACFSPFHFHRLFLAWIGETFGDYLRRRRVEVAAMRLVSQPQARVLDIALSVGFGSAEAFTRAFKSRFDSAPTNWRAQQHAQRRKFRKFDQIDSKFDQTRPLFFEQHAISSNLTQEILMKVILIDRQPVTIAYLRHHGAYGESVERFWQEVYVPWAITNRLGVGHARYGISHDDPSITASEQCRYDACAEVEPDFVATGGSFKTTIPGGKYATLKFKGTAQESGDAWAALLRDWLPSSGWQLDNRPSFEYYPQNAVYDPLTQAFECELCIPVMPL